MNNYRPSSRHPTYLPMASTRQRANSRCQFMETPRSRPDEDDAEDVTADVASPSHEPKKRKIRKGTQSCWECKRRKVRCVFSSPPDDAAGCIGCHRRGTRCIGQEFPDEPPPRPPPPPADGGGGSSRQVLERLSQMESAIEKLAQRAGMDGQELLSSLAAEGRDDDGGRQSTPRSTNAASRRGASVPDRNHDALRSALLEAWPCRKDLDLLCRTPGLSVPYYILSSCPENASALPRDLLRPPPSCSHPLLLARSLLYMAALLQNIEPGSEAARDLQAGLTVDYHDLMSRAIEVAVTLAISNDELVQSVEGIESICIEGMYHNSAGNLRRAFVATRRAMTIAQTIGLHREFVSVSSLPALEPEARSSLDPRRLWFRIVQSDRYLSMMLGLPHGTVENSFATPSALKSCSPLDRMRRMTSVAGGRIIERNRGGGFYDLSSTREIDGLMQQAAAEMPAQWWLVPNFQASRVLDSRHKDDAETVHRETMRIMDQLSYYHLLSQLYFPYLLQSAGLSEHLNVDPNKIVAINASREVLTRFVVFRDNRPVSPCCRGVDYLAFIACIALCLAHVDDHSRHHPHQHHHSPPSVSFLAHQRRGDVGQIERTLEIMEDMVKQYSHDAIASKIVFALRRLLAIECDAASGTRYSVISLSGLQNDEGCESLECNSKASGGGERLCIQIPSCATVTLERRLAVDGSVGEDMFQGASLFMPWMTDAMDDWSLRDDNMVFLDSLATD